MTARLCRRRYVYCPAGTCALRLWDFCMTFMTGSCLHKKQRNRKYMSRY